MKEIASLDSFSIFGCKDSANRMKNQMFLDFSEVQPIFNVVKDTTFFKFFYIQSKKIQFRLHPSSIIHHPSSIIHQPSAFFLEEHRGLVLVSYLTGNIYATASHKSVISPTASGKSLAISPTAKNGKNVTRDA